MNPLGAGRNGHPFNEDSDICTHGQQAERKQPGEPHTDDSSAARPGAPTRRRSQLSILIHLGLRAF